jgi:hypothetical protein
MLTAADRIQSLAVGLLSVGRYSQMFDPSAPDALVLSAEATQELRSDHFNVKRWVSRALTEARKKRDAAGPVSTTTTHPMTHIDPASSAAASPTGTGAALRPPLQAATGDEGAAQQLVTLLGVKKQTAAEALEDTITGALRYLPRATEDLSRLADDAAVIRQRLSDVHATTSRVRQSSEVSEKLKALHHVRERLVHCRNVLSDAQLLTSRVASVESAIEALPSLNQPPPGTVGSPASMRPRASTTQVVSASDMDEFNRIADDIATMRAALRTLQGIDPNYGASVRAQVDRFELQMQRGLENQCLDALKHENRTSAPSLLTALAKIGRDAGVVKTHSTVLVKARVDKLRSDVLGIPTAAPPATTTATRAPSPPPALPTPAPDKLLPAYKRYLQALVKTLLKDQAFLLDVLPKAASTSAAGHAGDLSSMSSTAAVAPKTSGAGASGAAGGHNVGPARLTGKAAFVKYLSEIIAAVSQEMARPVSDLPNVAAASMAETTQAEFVVPLLRTLLPASEALTAAETAERFALARSALQPFVASLPAFARHEIDAIAVVKASKASEFNILTDAIVQSATRVTGYMGTLHGGQSAKEGLQLPDSFGESQKAITTVTNAWAAAVTKFADRVLDSLPKQPQHRAGGGNTREVLEEALGAYRKCGELPAQTAHLASEVSAAFSALEDSIPPEVWAQLRLEEAAKGMAATATAKMAKAPAESRATVLTLLLVPTAALMPTVTALKAAAASTQGQSESARELGDWIMELPMTLDSAGVLDETQEWVDAAVSRLVDSYIAALRSVVNDVTKPMRPAPAAQPGGRAPSPPPAAAPVKIGKDLSDAMLADIEALEHVVAAVNETAENTERFREIRRVVLENSADE